MTVTGLAGAACQSRSGHLPDDPEFMRKKYRELALGLILIDVLMEEEAEAKELGITVRELMDRRGKEQLKQGNENSAAGTQ